MALNISRQGKVFAKLEATYGTEEPLVALDAVRHLSIAGGADAFQRVTSREKKQSPGPVNRFDRRFVSNLGGLEALVRPSGTLNTLAEASDFFEAAFGTRTNVTISATVLTAASTPAEAAPTTTAFAITDIGELAVGDAVLVNATTGGRQVRWITAIAAAAGVAPKKLITVAPPLTNAPILADTVKGGSTYKLSTALAKSLTVAHYMANFKREWLGVGIDGLDLSFDANEEPRFKASGPGKDFLTGTTQAEPGAFTTAGANPPSGITGSLRIAGTAYLFKKLGIQLKNGLKNRAEEYGVNKSSEIYRANRRDISLSLETFAETEATLYDLTEAGTNATLVCQTGLTEGNIVAVYAPVVEWKIPDQDDGDEAAHWTFKGMALESADAQNDELFLALM